MESHLALLTLRLKTYVHLVSLPVPLKVFLKRVPPGFENYVDYWSADIQCLNTRSEYCKQCAERIIQDLVTPNHHLYSLILNNCRDNTRDVVNRVCESGQCIGANSKDARQMIQKTKHEDGFLFCLVVILVVAFFKATPQK